VGRLWSGGFGARRRAVGAAEPFSPPRRRPTGRLYSGSGNLSSFPNTLYAARRFPATARRIDPTACRSLRRLADAYDGSQKLTTARRWLRRPADAYGSPQMLTAARRWLRRLADAYDGSQMLTTARRCLRRPADAYDGPQMVTTARRCLRRPADGYDGSQMVTAARRNLTTSRRWLRQLVVTLRRAVGAGGAASTGWLPGAGRRCLRQRERERKPLQLFVVTELHRIGDLAGLR
jgi:hypothetical protein